MHNGGFYAKLADPSSMGKLVREVKKFFHFAESLLSYIQSNGNDDESWMSPFLHQVVAQRI